MVATIALKKDFTNGQGIGSTNYLLYTEDHDENYTTLETFAIQAAAELNALQGGGAFVNYDLVRVGDAASPGGNREIGVIGAHSYRVSINGDTSKLDVTAGSAFIAGNTRVENPGSALLTGPGGGADEHFIAIDTSGFASIQVDPGLKSIDVASATWDGVSAYTNVTAFENIGTALTDDFLASIMFDGDAHIRMLERPVTGNFVAKFFLNPDARINAIERKLQNVSTDSEGHAIGDLQLDAAEVTLGLLAHERGGIEADISAVVVDHFIVGTGTGTMGLRIGSTARDAMGVGTSDTPEFTRLGLGVPASINGQEVLILTRDSANVEVLLTRSTDGAILGLIVTDLEARIASEGAFDLSLRAHGVAGANERIRLTDVGSEIKDDAALTVIEVGASNTIGFFGSTPVVEPTVTGSRAGNAALASLLTELATLGILTDGSS